MKISDFLISDTDIPHAVDWEAVLRAAPAAYASRASVPLHHKRLKQCHLAFIDHLHWERDRRLARVEEAVDGVYELRREWGDDPVGEVECAMFLANRAYDRLAVHQSYSHYEEQLYRAYAEAIRHSVHGERVVSQC